MANTRSRRRFLRDAGATGAALALFGACSRHDSTVELELGRLFSSDGVIAAGVEQRLPFGLIDNGAPVVGEGSAVDVRVLYEGDEVAAHRVPSRLVTHDHPDQDADEPHEHSDIVRYFPLRTTLPEPGIYDVEVSVGDQRVVMPVQAFPADEVAIVVPGTTFPALATPTLTEPGSMDPICTRFESPCPFHERSVADVLDASEPLAFLIASPRYCQTSYCGPVLQTLIDAAAGFPSVRPVHLEVYENPDEVDGDLLDERLRLVSAFDELGLTFEPSLFLVDRDGVLVDRIDNVFDRSELELGLASIA